METSAEKSPTWLPPQNLVLKKIDEELTCDVCLEQYINPRTLPCLHSFCLECIQKLPKKEKGVGFVLDCPKCRTSHDMSANSIDKLPHAFHINNLFEIQRQIANTPSTPSTPQTPLDFQEQRCPEHNDLLRVFCVTCNRLICRDCSVSTHRRHDYNLVSDLYPLACLKINGQVQGMRENKEKLESSMSAILDREREVREQGDRVKQKISDRTAMIIEMLKSGEEKLHGKVDNAVTTKCKWLTVQREDINEALQHVVRETKSIEYRIQMEKPADILYGQGKILEGLNEVGNRVNRLVLFPAEEVNIGFTSKDVSTDVGSVEASFMDSNCEVSLGMNNPCLIAGITMHMKLSLSADSKVPSIPLCLVEFNVVSTETLKQLPTRVTQSNHLEYTLSFKPQEPGRHDIKVMMCGKEIQGSPITMMASYSPELKSRRTQVIPKLNRPHGCVLMQGTLIVAEYGAHRIVFINPTTGNKFKSFGSKGSGRGQFTHPRGIALAVDGISLLVTDNHRIQHLTLEGEVIAIAGGNKNGTSHDEFYNPTGIAVNPTDGTIYVADTDNNRVQVLNSSLDVKFSFGRSANIFERLQGPYDVALDNQGNVYVVDGWNHCIKLFNPKGRYLSRISREGSGLGELTWPTALAVNNSEFLYVTEQDNKRVSIFTGSGKFVSCFDNESSSGFSGPQDIFVDFEGNVYVSDTYDDKIYIFYV